MSIKIKAARDLLSKNAFSSDEEILAQLKEVTDKADLLYNDVKIKRLKSRNAQQMMKELEVELGMILEKAKKISC